MKTYHKIICIIAGLLVSATLSVAEVDPNTPHFQRPQEKYGSLFGHILMNDSLFGPNCYFADSKDFLDRIPSSDLTGIAKDFDALKPKTTASISRFLTVNFHLQPLPADTFKDTSDIDTHIRKLWDYLTRHSANGGERGTLIPLKYRYVVPGGRFQEIYYWDSYFTLLGLMADNPTVLACDMVRNFAALMDEIGFVPNGNRTYYLGRSQPPFFSYMVEALAEKTGDKGILSQYLPEMIREYRFWMKGSETLTETNSQQLRCVRMPGGEVLNRYYDNYDTPREEMYRNDVATGRALSKVQPRADLHALYRNLRAGAESGWDFSSRWMRKSDDLTSISTTDYVTVDLNCLLYHLEMTIAQAMSIKGDLEEAAKYDSTAHSRARAILHYLWDADTGSFTDWDCRSRSCSHKITAATAYPLFVGIADQRQAVQTAQTIKRHLLKPGGIVTTDINSGQQWDAPNGWAPLQWISFKGLYDYGMLQDADTIKERWMKMVENVYHHSHKILEKYNVIMLSDTGGGEYPNQDGFGWTNGVYRAMKTFCAPMP